MRTVNRLVYLGRAMSPDPNPYAPPGNDVALDARARTKTLFFFAGGAAWLAAVWWAVVAAVTLFAVSAGNITPLFLVLPLFLVVAYAVRGAQIMKGDVRAAQRILLLHAVGAVAAILQLSSRRDIVVILNGVKVAIHLLGIGSAYWARRTYVDLATRRE